MALPGTHLRVALELKDKIGAVDLHKYLSGTIYPDSRSFTKINRDLTHGEDQSRKDFYYKDDFKKGWAIHLLYDEIQLAYIKGFFSDLFDDIENKLEQGGDNWITLTAIKVHQDLLDITSFSIINYLSYLNYSESPNNESEGLLDKYNSGIVKVYSNLPGKPDEYYERFVVMGTPSEYAAKIVARADELAKDELIMSKIKKIYPETMKIFYDSYPTL